MNQFFESETTQRVIAKFTNRIDGLTYETDFENTRSQYLLIVCKAIKSNPKLWDERCQINIGWVGDHLLHFLSERTSNLDKDDLDSAMGLLFRFLLEYHLSTPNDMHRDLERIRRFCTENADDFNEEGRSDIYFSIREMPIAILKEIANSPAIESVRKLHVATSEFEDTKNRWDVELRDREEKASKLKESLDSYKNAFNFVGLSEGFNLLAEQKKQEVKDVLFWLRLVSILIVLPLAAEVAFVLVNIDKGAELSRIMMLVALPTVSLIAILVYYFRVLLSNYKSLQSQLLQIDLRMTLCRFIHNYSEYASDMKKQDKFSLEKFENIIFSGITTSTENIPSTFDGVEQLGKLIKSVKQ
ncbi:hypothetical protein JN652_003653 [Vibrio cholerae]|uniref:hypothetical protein n=1 Tax=Vibrio cholerae TaxID=666 RepID=UPI001C6749BB|nr:hypothetical protein [Vibrio cholerae]EGR2026979.1 hypothetical protein [Vibrio cholerae]EHE0026547.1 hypothetical protein [Vibrio cholerae]